MLNTYFSIRPNLIVYSYTKLNFRIFSYRALLYFFITASFCLQWSCENTAYTEAEASFAKSDRLTKAIQRFEVERRESRGGLEQAYYRIDTILESYQVENARHLTLAFEDVWLGVIKQIQDLKTSFKKISSRSESYFVMLNQLTSEIKDETRRQQIEVANQQLRRQWELELNKASAKLKGIDLLLEGGGDLFRIMLINSLQATITKEVGQLQSITKEADQLLLDLQKLSQEGLKIFSEA